VSTPTDNAITIPAVIEQTRDDLRRFDFTAIAYLAAVVALCGALLGALAELGRDVPRVVLLALAPAALPATAVIICATLVLWARTSPPAGPPKPGSWVHAVHEPSWRTLLTAYQDNDLAEAAARRLWILARITARKFRWLRRATVGIVVLAAYLLCAGIYIVLIITVF
jgi:hypothetical protein